MDEKGLLKQSRKCKVKTKIKMLTKWQSNSTAKWVFALHVANLGRIPSILYGPLITAKNDP